MKALGLAIAVLVNMSVAVSHADTSNFQVKCMAAQGGSSQEALMLVILGVADDLQQSWEPLCANVTSDQDVEAVTKCAHKLMRFKKITDGKISNAAALCANVKSDEDIAAVTACAQEALAAKGLGKKSKEYVANLCGQPL